MLKKPRKEAQLQTTLPTSHYEIMRAHVAEELLRSDQHLTLKKNCSF